MGNSYYSLYTRDRLINYLYNQFTKKEFYYAMSNSIIRPYIFGEEEFTMKIQEVWINTLLLLVKMHQISDVADLLVKYNLTAVSVVDDNNKLLGIISEGDLLYKKVRPHVPHYVNVFRR